MGDRGWLSGAAMHSEYHTIERKKKKAANCIFQRRDRTCMNEKSPCYLGKCFEATWCTYRVKEKKTAFNKNTNESVVVKESRPKEEKYKNIKCSLPMGTIVTNKRNVQGELVDYNREKRYIYVKYPGKDELIKYSYPEAFLNKFLTVDAEYDKCIAKDIVSIKK